jgi:copper transport protein
VAGSSDPAVTAVHGAVQGVSYVALLLAAGLAVFLVLLLPSAAALGAVRGRLLRVTRIAAGVAVTGFLLLVPIGATYQQGTGLAGLTTRAAWRLESFDGVLFLVVLFGLGVAVGLLGAQAPDRSDQYVVPAVVATALGAVAIVGHTRAYGPTGLVVVSDVVHVLAGAVWFGGLVGLVAALPALANREGLATTTLARFSTLAGGMLAVVAVTGVLLGWRILGSWGALVSTPYGLILLAKAALVACVAAMGGWNRWRLLPSVLAAAGHQQRVQAAGRLRTTVRREAVGIVAVLLLTGFLVNQVPREVESTTGTATERDVLTAVTDDVRVVGRLDPGTVGPNTLTVQLQDPAGEPLEPFARPVVSVGSDEVDLGSRPLRNVDSGTYETEVVIPEPGTWEVRVSVRLDEFTNPVLTLPVEVAQR